ncbi:MAG: S-layer homology domain-containing protein, partial [Butyricicoccus sp.]|nr:S-layer homology domain-containing protein [Butyricicoccus sp.]
MKKKLLSVLLVVCMMLTLMPMAALADFADTDGHWGKDAIDRWASVGVLNGKADGVFDPNGTMTRAEFAQMLCNMMGYTEKAPNNFADIPDDAWYADAMLKLVAAGVINGTSATTASPNATITREMAAVMLARAFDIKPSSSSLSYADAGSVSSWAAGAVAALTERGMMNGVGDNQVAPQLDINRASVAALADKMIADYVTEDKTITGEVNGIVIVAAGAKVTVEDASLNAPLVVAPAAEGAEVALTGTTKA